MSTHRSNLPKSKVALLGTDRTFSMQYIPLSNYTFTGPLVQVDCCTLCKSDLHTASGKRKEALPSILGHEAVGTIVELPPYPMVDIFGSPLAVGDRIVWAIYAIPENEGYAKRGIAQKTPGVRKYGHLEFDPKAPFTGGLASHIHLFPGTPIAKVASHIPVEILAPVNCSLATMVGAFRLGGGVANKRVAIIGAGMLGVQGAAYAQTLGAAAVTVVDIDPHRLDFARRFGADTGLLPSEIASKKRFDLIIESSGSQAGMVQSLSIADLGANIIWVGAVFPQAPIAVNPEQLIRKLHSLKGLHNYTPQDFQQAVAYIIKHHADFPFGELVEKTYPLDQVGEAFEWAYVHKPYRVGVTWGGKG